MDSIQKGWFSEASALTSGGAGQAISLEVTKELHHEKSEFQDILFFHSSRWGNVLVLDGSIQCTERDEFAYQEMIAHLPLYAHPNPKKVLIIGGGDGGVLREVLKHPGVESVIMCEIDKRVVELSKQFLPDMASGFNDPRATLFIGDGLKFMSERENEFDVIITDSSDPVGPAESLFGAEYYKLVKRSLREGGIACSQAESLWLHLDTIHELVSICKGIFSSVDYPAGAIGYLIVSNSTSSKNPQRTISPSEQSKLKYYNQHIHNASFQLPQFAHVKLGI